MCEVGRGVFRGGGGSFGGLGPPSLKGCQKGKERERKKRERKEKKKEKEKAT